MDAPGPLSNVILRGIDKRRIVKDVADHKNFVKRLEELSANTDANIYAWALKTNNAHILLRSSKIGLSGFMRRYLTGYAISYNRRHRRWGHLFLSEVRALQARGKTATPVKRIQDFYGTSSDSRICPLPKASIRAPRLFTTSHRGFASREYGVM